MTRFGALALTLTPLALVAAAAPVPVQAQAADGLAQVQAHLRAVNSMTASFTQSDRRGQTVSGTLTMKQPGRIRFDYGRSANMLIVGDGRALTFVDYDARQVQRWPIGDSPLSVLLDASQDLSRFARVVRNDAQVLTIEARDPRRREFGTITLAFSKNASGPAGLILQGWNTIDAQNNLTTVRLANQRFNVPVADSLFRYRDPRRQGPRG
ncbi:outer membrane lipoprotein carrier protein LolA [Sphingosinicella sp. LHD-64]|uniref:LolA family protein n=1 Tax=Sphingosinicella sp. LHD-64 TaxID=3072139 RepID=UPI00280C71D7|nr:outer membrane lipoprotein carrier protein LolA [Sphingosinicella sp. LHD-64]MDQ8757048.1 outer membrane lipoprotein carrier protein LolA [Sphingosinicella sp. LHD-64]